jgi:hypothetical protein
MNHKNRLAGRFLPSRVYARWKWTVRFGLSALPLTLFIAGSVTYYLTPSRYESTAVFEYRGKRPPAEAAALLKSGNVIGPAITSLKLTERLGLDVDSLMKSISGKSRTTVDSGTGMIELTVEDLQGEIARDLAAQLPKSLDAYEKSLAVTELTARIEDAGQFARDTEDILEERRMEVSKWLVAHRGVVPDALDQLEIDDLRGNWEHAMRRTHEAQDRRADAQIALSSWASVVQVHSQPVISNEPVGRKPDESMGAIIGESLGVGLAFALLAPYLLELAFPRRRQLDPARTGPWHEAADDADFPGEPANG